MTVLKLLTFSRTCFEHKGVMGAPRQEVVTESTRVTLKTNESPNMGLLTGF